MRCLALLAALMVGTLGVQAQVIERQTDTERYLDGWINRCADRAIERQTDKERYLDRWINRCVDKL